MEKPSLDDLMSECLIRDNFYDEFEDIEDCWLNLVKCEDYWIQLFNLKLNRVELKEFFLSESDEQRLDYFKFGIACCVHFIQANFTGPQLPEDTRHFLDSDFFKGFDYAQRLMVVREEINANTKYPCLLVCAELIFDSCVVHKAINLWWGLRVMKIHQEVLDEPSSTIIANADQFCKLLMEADLIHGNDRAMLDIELVNFYMFYRNFMKTHKHLASARDILEIDFKFIKNKDTGQNYVKVVYIQDEDDCSECSSDDDGSYDDVRVEMPKILDKIPIKKLEHVERLTNLEQKLCLAIAREVFTSISPDDLDIYDVHPYLDVILNQKTINYTTKLATILLRCDVESKPGKIYKRCLQHFSDISKCYYETVPLTVYRLKDFFSTRIPPVWTVKKLLVAALINVGSVVKGLDICLEIQAWDEMLVCYDLLHQTDRVITIIEEILTKDKDNIKYICLQGDAKGDESYYKTAWKLSLNRSHRVQRHWGQFLFKRKKYKECVPHYEKSLSINPYQHKIWLRLGFAALQSENWEVAATAYRRYISLEPASFNGWNNLAQAYVKCDNKLCAHYAISQALKYKSDCWKIWENFLVINIELLYNLQAIDAYNRILDISEDYLNLPILNFIVYKENTVNNNSNNNNNKKKSRNNNIITIRAKEKTQCDELLKQSQSLVGRLISIDPENPNLWETYAQLTDIPLLKTQRLHKAFSILTEDSEWTDDLKMCKQLLVICIKLAELVLSNDFDYQNYVVDLVRTNLELVITSLEKKLCCDISVLLASVIQKYKEVAKKLYNNNNIDKER